MRVAILGGSFNPIHNSHIKFTNYLINKDIVDRVWLMPCGKHSFDKSLESATKRVNMIKLSFKSKKIKICYIELKSKRKSYTITTFRKLRKKYKHEFYFVIGSDILKQIRKWHKYRDVKKEIDFILFKRKNYKITNPEVKINKIINYKQDNISSSEIRERLKQGKSISAFVPKSVERYIKKNKLYNL